MDAVGLITEYNPFHNGHLHHLRESRRESGAEVAVAVMSGHFLQRGEPALLDKWVRAEMALRAGVDVVVEIPFPFACNSAPHFARGAVQLLDAFGGAVTSLCFGSETGELGALQRCSDLLSRHETAIQPAPAPLPRQGPTFPAAPASARPGDSPRAPEHPPPRGPPRPRWGEKGRRERIQKQAGGGMWSAGGARGARAVPAGGP